MRFGALALAAGLLTGCLYFEQKKVDEELQTRIFMALREDTMARQLVPQLRITVHNGRVGVQGHVAGEIQRRKVIGIIELVEGVLEVIDSLTVDDGMNIGGGGMYAY